MKLISCEIEQFGTLSHEKLEFESGLNVIKRENGWGKTTFAAFVQAMFYGLDSGRKNDIREAERRHFKPWAGGNYGGSLIFEVEGKRYRMERYFATTQKEDTFLLYDDATGLLSEDFDDNIGEALFGMNKEAYAASSYIPQAGVSFHPNDSLTAKLSVENGTNPEMDMNRYSDAVKRLKSARQELMKTGKKGRIWELRNHLDQNKERLQLVNNLTEILDQRKEEEKSQNLLQSQQEEQLIKVKSQIRQQSIAERRIVVQRQLEDMKKKAMEIASDLKEMEEFFQTGVPEDETIISYKELQRQLEEALHEKEIYSLSQQELELLNQREPCESELVEMKEKLQVTERLVRTRTQQTETSSNTKPEKQTGLICVALILVLTGVVAGIVMHPVLILFGCIPGVLLLTYAFKQIKSQQKEQMRKLQQVEEQVLNILQNYHCASQGELYDVYLQLERQREQQQQVKQKQEKLQNAQDHSIRIREQIMEFLLKFYPQPEAGIGFYLTDLSNRKRDYLQKRNGYHQFLREIDQYTLEHNEDLTKEIDESLPSLLVLQQNQEDLEHQIQVNQQEIRANHEKMNDLTEQMNEQQELQSDIEREEDELEECEHRLFVIDQTSNLLEEAKNRYAEHYLGEIQKGFTHYMNCLTEKKLGEPIIDVGLQVSFREEGGTREIGYYSAGYQDLIGICGRFALVDAIFEQEKPFLILDDPFINLDEKKMKDAHNILEEIASRYQIIHLICHQNRA